MTFSRGDTVTFLGYGGKVQDAGGPEIGSTGEVVTNYTPDIKAYVRVKFPEHASVYLLKPEELSKAE